MVAPGGRHVALDPLSGGGAGCTPRDAPDLQARRVRFIDDAGRRIAEDYLRILRFFRFHAWYGDPDTGLDAEGLAAVAAHLDGLDGLSRERVGAEIVKLLSAPDPVRSVAAMRASGVLQRVLPGSDDRALGPLVHFELVLGMAPDPMRRLACLVDADAAEKLRLSKAQHRQIDVLHKGVSSGASVPLLGYRHGASTGLDIVALRAAMFETSPEEDVIRQLEIGAQAKFPVTASDLMPELEGPALGQALKDLETRWITSGFKLTKTDLLTR